MESCRKLEYVRVNVGLVVGILEWFLVLFWGVGVGLGFDDGGVVCVGVLVWG